MARSVGHGRASTDNDKRSYNNRGSGVDRAISRNVRAARERLDRLRCNPVEPPAEPLRFSATLTSPNKDNESELLAVSNISMSYDGRCLFKGISFGLKNRDRLAIVGPNGSGKSTLIKIITGRIVPDSGVVSLDQKLRLGLLDQHPRDFPSELNLGQAFIWGLQELGLKQISDEARGWLVRWGLFRRADLQKSVIGLSTGQLRKLEIALIFGSKPDLLILDEPTNHVSLSVLESFEQALTEFSGPILAVSHDRRFLSHFGGE